jgi:CheY-like chemotaxis protein
MSTVEGGFHPKSQSALLAIPPPSILVVDDSRANRLAYESLLKDLGKVVLVESGQEALRRVQDDPEYAVILLDMRMPILNGLETAKLIRQRHKAMETTIIFMTAFEPSHEEVAETYQSGGTDFVTTPVDNDLMRRKVSTFVRLYRRAAEARKEAEELRRANESLRVRVKELEDTVAKLPPATPPRS